MSAAPPIPPGTWWAVLTRKATFAVIVADGRVVAAAPYGRRLVGLTEEQAANELRASGARFHCLG